MGVSLRSCRHRLRLFGETELQGDRPDVTRRAMGPVYCSTSAFVCTFRTKTGCSPQAYMCGRVVDRVERTLPAADRRLGGQING